MGRKKPLRQMPLPACHQDGKCFAKTEQGKCTILDRTYREMEACAFQKERRVVYATEK